MKCTGNGKRQRETGNPLSAGQGRRQTGGIQQGRVATAGLC